MLGCRRDPGFGNPEGLVGKPARECPCLRQLVRRRLDVALSTFDIVRVVDDWARTDVVKNDVSDLVKEREQHLVEPLAATREADDWYSV